MTEEWNNLEEVLLQEPPAGVSVLPKDWKGETVRAMLTFPISQRAYRNKKFDVWGFIRKKFYAGLARIRRMKDIQEICIVNCTMIVDGTDKEIMKIYISVDYAKK
jgi:hypothetical protein